MYCVRDDGSHSWQGSIRAEIAFMDKACPPLVVGVTTLPDRAYSSATNAHLIDPVWQQWFYLSDA
jgi:hypothetical protein